MTDDELLALLFAIALTGVFTVLAIIAHAMERLEPWLDRLFRGQK